MAVVHPRQQEVDGFPACKTVFVATAANRFFPGSEEAVSCPRRRMAILEIGLPFRLLGE